MATVAERRRKKPRKPRPPDKPKVPRPEPRPARTFEERLEQLERRLTPGVMARAEEALGGARERVLGGAQASLDKARERMLGKPQAAVDAARQRMQRATGSLFADTDDMAEAAERARKIFVERKFFPSIGRMLLYAIAPQYAQQVSEFDLSHLPGARQYGERLYSESVGARSVRENAAEEAGTRLRAGLPAGADIYDPAVLQSGLERLLQPPVPAPTTGVPQEAVRPPLLAAGAAQVPETVGAQEPSARLLGAQARQPEAMGDVFQRLGLSQLALGNVDEGANLLSEATMPRIAVSRRAKEGPTRQQLALAGTMETQQRVVKDIRDRLRDIPSDLPTDERIRRIADAAQRAGDIQSSLAAAGALNDVQRNIIQQQNVDVAGTRAATEKERVDAYNRQVTLMQNQIDAARNELVGRTAANLLTSIPALGVETARGIAQYLFDPTSDLPEDARNKAGKVFGLLQQIGADAQTGAGLDAMLDTFEQLGKLVADADIVDNYPELADQLAMTLTALEVQLSNALLGRPEPQPKTQGNTNKQPAEQLPNGVLLPKVTQDDADLRKQSLVTYSPLATLSGVGARAAQLYEDTRMGLRMLAGIGFDNPPETNVGVAMYYGWDPGPAYNTLPPAEKTRVLNEIYMRRRAEREKRIPRSMRPPQIKRRDVRGAE